MKRRIYWSMCLTAFFTMLLTSIVFSAAFFSDTPTQQKRETMREAVYVAAAMENLEDPLEWLKTIGSEAAINRITWIRADGSIIYDNKVKVETMENHKNRPEVAEAMEYGIGEAIRESNTLAEEIYYYAVKLDDGTILRLSIAIESTWFALLTLVPWLAIALIVVFGLTMSLSEIQTSKIIGPLNSLNLDHPEEERLYDELSPLVDRLKKQNQTIEKQIEQIKENQREFTAITEHMQEGLLVVDSRAEVISYNRSAVRILGIDKLNLPKKELNILHVNRSTAFQQTIGLALKGTASEKIIQLNDRYYQLLANPVPEYRDRNGVVVLILDVTEKQQREEFRREFSANVSHELKTPLTSISGYAEIMKGGLVEPADMPRFAEHIYDEAGRLMVLVEDIIKLSRLDEQGEHQQIEKEPVDLFVVAGDVVERLKDRAAKRSVTLSLQGEGSVIEGSWQILNEVVYNICDNAIKYNKPSGSVAVSVINENGKSVLTVKDTGIGIPGPEQERIFERFYRIDKSHSRQIGGTGLGLAIVKNGVKYHDGHIELESEPGEGTVIRVYFSLKS